jgi:hypothetical protein
VSALIYRHVTADRLLARLADGRWKLGWWQRRNAGGRDSDVDVTPD